MTDARYDDPRDDPNLGDDPNRPISRRRPDTVTDPRDDPNLVGAFSGNFFGKNGAVQRPDDTPPPQQVADLGSQPTDIPYPPPPGLIRPLPATMRTPTPTPPPRTANLGPMQGQPPPSWPPPFAMNRRQWYFSPPARGPGMWGTPRGFPMLPPLWQVPMLFSRIGMGLNMFGSPAIAMLGFGLNKYTLAFMNGMQKGQAQYSRQMRDMMDMQADQLEQEQQRELDDYNETFRSYVDPEHFDQIKPENIPKLKAALYQIAGKYHDDKMKAALDNNDIQGAIDLLKYRDQQHGDLKASKAARGKGSGRAPTKEEIAEAAWEGKPAPGSEKPAEGVRIPRSEAEEREMMRPRRPAEEPSEPVPGKLSDTEEAIAHRRWRGEETADDRAGMPEGVLARTAKRAADLDRAFHKAILENSTPDDRIAAIRKFDPTMANELDAMTHYRGKVPYARGGVEPKIVSMAQDVDESFNPNLMSYIQEVRKPGDRDSNLLVYSQSLSESQMQVLAAAKKLLEDNPGMGMSESPTWNTVKEWIDTGMLGKDKWSGLFVALNNYNEALVRVTRGTAGAEADIQRGILKNRSTSSLRQILTALKIDSADIFSQTLAVKSKWDSLTRGKAGDLPGYNEDAFKHFGAIRSLDEEHFTFSKDAPEDLRNLEPGGTGLKEDPEIEERRKKAKTSADKVPKEATETREVKGKLYYKTPDGNWHEVR